MKNFQSTIEGQWIEIKQISLSREQKELLNSKKIEDKETINALTHTVKNQQTQLASEEDVVIIQRKYELNKPTVDKTDQYIFISADISMEGLSMTGIINYRINGKHKQIRF